MILTRLLFGVLAPVLVMLSGTALAASESPVLPDWLMWLNNADVAYVIFLLALLGLLVEIASPGVTLPGLFGALGIILSLYALQILGANMPWLLLMLVAVGFIVLPLFRAGIDRLAWLGVALLGLGSFLFLDTPALMISLPLMVGLTLVAGWMFLWVVSRFARLRNITSVSGHDALLGRPARVTDWFGVEGRVELNGTFWAATSDSPLASGDKVEVVAVDGLTLSVRKIQE